MKHGVYFRKKVTVNTDPQRRCYDGCHFSSEEVWTPWELVCAYTEEDTAASSMQTFQDINPSRQYRVEPITSKEHKYIVDETVATCCDCGAFSLTRKPEDITHYDNCVPGDAEKWEKYYEEDTP